MRMRVGGTARSTGVAFTCMVLAMPLLYACRSSPPTRYYTLNDIAPNAAPTGLAATRIRVERVTIPSELDRPELVRRVDSTQLHISGFDRWAAPLDEMIRRVLSVDLAARLPPGMITDISDPRAGHQPRSLSLDVQEFYADAGCAITLRASWSLSAPRTEDHSQPPTQPLASPHATEPVGATEDIHLPAAGACPQALPDGMSRALASLSDRVAAAVTRSSP